VDEGMAALQKQYPDFTYFYFSELMPPQTPAKREELVKIGKDSLARATMKFPHAKQLLTYPTVRKILDTTQIVYQNFEPIRVELQKTFRNLTQFFPKYQTPEVYTFISEYGYAVLLPPKPNTIAIGLDLFLGESHKDYSNPLLQMPNFVTKTFTPAHIPVRVVEAILTEEMGNATKGDRMIDRMIANGKRMYILDKVLPELADSVKWGFTNAQVKWCRDNESEMWAFFTTQKLLYATEMRKIRTYIENAPNSTNMPPESPGRTGDFIGFKIVSQFMEKNPNTTFEQLLALPDAQFILDKSKYKPAR
jgi:hypothetical protein